MKEKGIYRHLLLFIAAVLLGFSWFAPRHLFYQSDLDKVSVHLSNRLSENEEEFYKIIGQESSIFNSLASHTYDESQLYKAAKIPFSIQIYEKSNLVFWNDQRVSLPESEVALMPNGVSFLFLQNGYYQVLKTSMPYQNGDDGIRIIVGFFLLQHKFNIDNKYLESNVNPNLDLPRGIVFSLTPEKNSKRIENKARTSSIYIYQDPLIAKDKPFDYFSYIGLLGLILLVIWIVRYADFINRRVNTELALGFLVITLFLLRICIYYFDFPISFRENEIFSRNQDVFILSESIGDLVINIIVFSIIIICATRFITIKTKDNMIKAQRRFFSGIAIFILLVSIFFVFTIARNLFLNTSFTLTVLDIVELNYASIFGLLGILILFYTLFVFILHIVDWIGKLGLDIRDRMKITAVCIALFSLIIWKEGYDIRYFITLIWGVCIVALLPDFIKGLFKEYYFGFLAWGVLFFSFFLSLFLYFTNIEREEIIRMDLAKKVALEIDQITEYRFVDISVGIMEDKIIQKYFTNPSLPVGEVEARIRKKYFDEYFTKYDISIFCFLVDGTNLSSKKNITLKEYEQKINTAHSTESNYLFLISNPDGNYSYVSKLPIFLNGDLFGFVVMELEQSRSGQANVYPELVIADKYKTPAYYEDISYAIYNKGNLRNFSGNYVYPLSIDTNVLVGKGDFVSVKLKGNSHLAFLADEDRVVLVTDQEYTATNWFSMFCYLLLLFFILVILFTLLYSYLYPKGDKGLFNNIFLSSLQKRINFGILSLVLVSLLIMGAVTISYFSSRYNQEQQERLMQKLKGIIASVELELSQAEPLMRSNLLSDNNLSAKLKSLSDIFGIDVNIYDNSGLLIMTSQTYIFEKGLISANMNPLAYFSLTRKGERQFIRNENIGKLNYLSGYGQLKNKLGKNIGFIQTPYFSREKEVKMQISNFLVTLINVYTIIFILSALIGIIVSNSITRSLTLIGSKLRNIRLGQTNEKLDWPYDDEIGALVSQYNTIIDELDKSTKLLVISERQIAWESMAKQIAHEIKNPLTPMKLSIQHLLRAQKENRANANELTERVCKTLIEQINHLSDIATEFGLYAKMPTTHLDVLNLQELTNSVLELYPDTDNVKVIRVIVPDPIMVLADQAQISRVLHNIMKNAFQAIPEDKHGMIVISLNKQNDDALLSIADTGVGILNEQVEKVFAPNFTTKSSGMGLGLAISKNIINNLGGEIWFESEIGKGTSFYVKLPLYFGDTQE